MVDERSERVRDRPGAGDGVGGGAPPLTDRSADDEASVRDDLRARRDSDVLPRPEPLVTAAATSGSGLGNTSEFSACAPVVADTGNVVRGSCPISGGTPPPTPPPRTGHDHVRRSPCGNARPRPRLRTRRSCSELAAWDWASTRWPPAPADACSAAVFTVTCDLGLDDPASGERGPRDHRRRGSRTIGADIAQFAHHASVAVVDARPRRRPTTRSR